MTDKTLSIGRGIADITGEPWGVGMMGYGMPKQWSQGILTRQYARAFVFDDGVERLAYIVADIGMFFQAAVEAVLERLERRFDGLYTARNVVLTATHTHCGPGGHGHHALYNVTTKGFHRRTFDRLVDGVVDAIAQAHSDAAPAVAVLNRGTLDQASVNRSQTAFVRNPAEEQLFFPHRIDPLTTLLRIERAGETVGVINWFAVHNTSMSNTNTLISSDNKGWAAYAWEREAEPGFVAAFAQTNAGDISPNLGGKERCGPTEDERENNRIIAERQLTAARTLAAEPGEQLAPLLQARMTYVDFARQQTAAGPTGRAVLGAAFAAGTSDGLGAPAFRQGKDNPRLQRVSEWLYRRYPGLGERQAPKDLALPVGAIGWVQEKLPVQLVRIGGLYLICLPIEVTITAGLRLRRAVAEAMGTDVDHVLVQGYANGYAHYLTTPEEYDEQRYEGGSTIFGRHQLPAFIEATVALATAMRQGTLADPGTSPRTSRLRIPAPTGSPRLTRERPVAVRSAPTSAEAGTELTVEFDADHPNATLRPTYLLVERKTDEGWETAADDSSFSTEISWRRERLWYFAARVLWRIPTDGAGTYRISYVGKTLATTPDIVVS